MLALARRHPLTSYFTLAFALSWIGVLAIVLPGTIPAPPADAQRQFAFVYLAMLVGPSVAGILMTVIADGADGLRTLRQRLTHWRVAKRWYAAALLVAPLPFVTSLAALAFFSPDFLPAVLRPSAETVGPVQGGSTLQFVLLGASVGIGAGLFEELGWTGFATPTMRARRGTVASGLTIGILWGAWHFLPVLWGSASAFGRVPVAVYLGVALFSFLPPYRVLMGVVYDRTRSLLVAVVMHASLTTTMIVLGPSAVGAAAIASNLAFAAVLWGAVAVVFAVNGRALKTRREPAPRLAAG